MKEIDRDKFHVEAKPEENTLYLNNGEKNTSRAANKTIRK